MDTEQPRVKEPYFLIQSEEDGNITVVASGKNGIEYNKTFGLVNKFPGVINLHCLFGQGLLVLQRNDFEGTLKEIKVFSLRPGSSVEIPANSSYCLVNTGRHFLVTLDNMLNNPKYHTTEPILVTKGLAYYVIEKKGEIAFEKNPNYKFHPQLVMEQ